MLDWACVAGHAWLGMPGWAMRKALTAGTHDERPIAVCAMGLSNFGNGDLIWTYVTGPM